MGAEADDRQRHDGNGRQPYGRTNVRRPRTRSRPREDENRNRNTPYDQHLTPIQGNQPGPHPGRQQRNGMRRRQNMPADPTPNMPLNRPGDRLAIRPIERHQTDKHGLLCACSPQYCACTADDEGACTGRCKAFNCFGNSWTLDICPKCGFSTHFCNTRATYTRRTRKGKVTTTNATTNLLDTKICCVANSSGMLPDLWELDPVDGDELYKQKDADISGGYFWTCCSKDHRENAASGVDFCQHAYLKNVYHCLAHTCGHNSGCTNNPEERDDSQCTCCCRPAIVGRLEQASRNLEPALSAGSHLDQVVVDDTEPGSDHRDPLGETNRNLEPSSASERFSNEESPPGGPEDSATTTATRSGLDRVDVEGTESESESTDSGSVV